MYCLRETLSKLTKCELFIKYLSGIMSDWNRRCTKKKYQMADMSDNAWLKSRFFNICIQGDKCSHLY